MRVAVANKDRGSDLGRELTEAAAARAKTEDAPEFCPPDFSALLLQSAENDADFLEKFVRLIWFKTGVSTKQVNIPHKPGFIGSIMVRFRRLFWKLFRYQHDWIAFQQNTINAQLTAAIEFMNTEHRARVERLEQRIAELEASSGRSSSE